MTASGVQWALCNSLTRREYISYLPVPTECSWGNVREGLIRQALLQCWRKSLAWIALLRLPLLFLHENLWVLSIGLQHWLYLHLMSLLGEGPISGLIRMICSAPL